ncbi:MAG TPA: TolC family protein, partial [Chthoniobacterales bacterium]|nr:TolC family protein [Chthoniobacterales bacterium]
MRLPFRAVALSSLLVLAGTSRAAPPSYNLEQAVALAQEKNPEIAIARKKVEAARGEVIEARSGFLPSVSSVGLLDKRQHERETRLRDEDYNAQLRLQQNLYTGGAITSQLAIARLNLDKAQCDLQETINRVAMDTRVAYSELLLNRARVRVREDSVRVLEQELKNQQERLRAGLVATLNVQRAEVTVANERPELINAQTDLQMSYLRLGEIFGMEWPLDGAPAPFDVAGQLQYQARHPVLNDCLARADAERPSIRAAQRAIDIEDRQYVLDKSEVRPHVGFFSGYEVYNERDPEVGQEFNYGYVFGINGTWHIFDGFATKGRL